MFEFYRQLRGNHDMIASESQQLTADQKQRDVYETHRHRVFSVSYYMTANEMEAEAILTETFVQAFAGVPEPDAHRIDQALLGELERRFSLAPAPSASAEKGVELERGQVRRTDLEEALATLPSRERLMFLLHDVEGYAPARIAALLGSQEQEVLQTLLSARIRMRNTLGQQRSHVAAAAHPDAVELEIAAAGS